MPLALALDSTATAPSPAPLPSGYTEELWRPRAPRLVPRGLPSIRFALYTLMHYLGAFANREYGLYLVRGSGGEVVHHSCVNPRDFRFPFMRASDLQIGDVETGEAHRGRGLAAHAIERIVAAHAHEGRTFWYIADEDNRASVRAAEKAGFTIRGKVTKRRRFGLSFLGSYDYSPL